GFAPHDLWAMSPAVYATFVDRTVNPPYGWVSARTLPLRSIDSRRSALSPTLATTSLGPPASGECHPKSNFAFLRTLAPSAFRVSFPAQRLSKSSWRVSVTLALLRPVRFTSLTLTSQAIETFLAQCSPGELFGSGGAGAATVAHVSS